MFGGIVLFASFLAFLNRNRRMKCWDIRKFSDEQKDALLENMDLPRGLLGNRLYGFGSAGKEFFLQINGDKSVVEAMRYNMTDKIAAQQFRFNLSLLIKL